MNFIGMKMIMNTEYPMIVLNNQDMKEENVIFCKHLLSFYPFKYKNFWYKDKKEDLKDFDNLINRSYKLLTDNGYKVNKEIFHIDLHIYNLNNNKIENEFAWHEDDCNGEEVNTVIYYLKKDSSILNGNFLYKNKNNKKCELDINNNMIVLLDGRIKHKPDDLEGKGSRKSIVVQFKRLE